MAVMGFVMMNITSCSAQAEEQASEEISAIKIALLLPLSGESQHIGKSLLNAAEMALLDLNREEISIITLDTEGTEEGSTKAAKKAVAREADVILGPLFSITTHAALEIIKDIPLISFSNDSSLATKGALVMGFVPSQQITQILDYAYEKGIRQFSSLAPDNNYGAITTKIMDRYLETKELQTHQAEWYVTADSQMSQSIRHLTEQPEDEMLDEEISEPVGEEALLVPEGGRTLISIAKRLAHRKATGGRQFRLLGSGEWDDDIVYKEPKLAGGWFITSPPAQRKIFEQRFVDEFGYKPMRISSLTYDAISMLGVLFYNKKELTRENIVNQKGYIGINGKFRFHDSGIVERLMSVMEITSNGLKEISPAPINFLR